MARQRAQNRDGTEKTTVSQGVGDDGKRFLEVGASVELHRSQSSVTVKRDAKGVQSYEVKVYADDVDDALFQAKAAAEDLDGFLAEVKEKGGK